MKQTDRQKRLWRTAIGLTIGVAAVLAIWRAWPRERLLTAVATPIVQVAVGREEICWLSSHECLLVTADHEPGYPGVRDPSDGLAHWEGTVDLLDISSHTRRPLEALTALFRREMAVPLTVPENLHASSDGQWIRWDTHAARGTMFMGRVVRLDGTHYRKWDLAPNGIIEFQQTDFFLDAGHLVCMSPRQPIMTVLDLQDPTRDIKYSKLKDTQEVLTQYARQHPVFHHGEREGEDAITITEYRTQDRMQEVLANGGQMREAPQPLQKMTRKLPKDATVVACKLSLQQNTAYHLDCSRTSTALTWLHRLLPTFTSTPRHTEELWVSRAEGGGMHEIGHVPIPMDATGQTVSPPDGLEYFLDDIQWLPDGKHVSFVYRGMLYVVPAEPAK